MNGIVWKLRAGAPWRDIPGRYGPWKTGHERLRRWSMDGTWGGLFEHAVVKDDAVGAVEGDIHIDSSVARAHQHAAGARRDRKKGEHRRAYRAEEKHSGGPAAG